MSIDSDVIRGHVDTIILKTLTAGDKYGYEIIKEIEQKSKGTYELKQPTLYSCLKRLQSQGLISAFWKNSDIGGKRHYYKLTKKGRETYENSMNDWFNSRSIIDSLMGSKPTNLVMAEEDDEYTPPVITPDLFEDEQVDMLDDVQDKPVKETAQMVLDESSNITQETEPRDFNIEDLDADDVALLGDYYKTDENQINLFEENESDTTPSQTCEQDTSANIEESSTKEIENNDILGNYDGTDLSKYRQNNKDNYFEKISYGIIDENNVNISVNEEDEQEEENIANLSTPDLSTFNFFTNYPQDEEMPSVKNNEPANNLPTIDEENSSERLHFGFGSTNEDDDMDMPDKFDDMSDLEDTSVEDFHPTISIYGDNDENDVVDYSLPAEQDYSHQENYSMPVSGDLKPFNIGNYTEPEYKEKLNQLSSYTKNNYDTQPVLTSGYNSASAEAKSITDLKEDLDQVGIRVRTYSKPEKEQLKDKKYLLVNKIKFVTSWIVFGIMLVMLGLTYVIANNVGYTDLSLVSSAMPVYVYFIFAGIIVLAVPITYTIIYLLNKTKRIKPNYNALISLVFALLFFIVCLNIIYTLNILNGFTKFNQMDYNHLLWLLPAVVSSLIVFQSLIYSLLFRTKRFNV